MSGPKVIDVAALRRLQKRQSLAALHLLERVVAECQNLEELPAATELLEKFHRLRDAEEWAQLSLEAPPQLDFYQERLQLLRHLRAAAHTATLRRQHRLHQAAANATHEAADAIATRKKQAEDSAQLQHLASAFVDPSEESIVKKISPTPLDPQEQRFEKCWDLLGRLTALQDSTDLKELTVKAETIRNAPAAQRPLLLDSLVLELSALLRLRQSMLEARTGLDAILADLSELNESTEWISRINAMLAHPTSLEEMQGLAREAKAWADSVFAEETRREQRTAILRALASAGYEVREGMATAWAQNGRIVLQKPNESQYGIEVSAPPHGNAFQTRVVAFTESRDPQRDLEIEQTWCGEFQKARESMAIDGFQTSLLQAHASGTIPLKLATASQSYLAHQQERKLLSAPPSKNIREI
jgi:hypothetical protein